MYQPLPPSLYRPDDGRLLAGVCLAFAHRFGIPATLVRLLWLAAAVLGVGVLAYLVAWLLIPDAQHRRVVDRINAWYLKRLNRPPTAPVPGWRGVLADLFSHRRRSIEERLVMIIFIVGPCTWMLVLILWALFAPSGP